MQRMLLICLLALAMPASAFINVESLRRETGKGFLGKSSLKFTGQKGNTNKLSTNITTLNVYRYDSDEWLVLADYVYSATRNIKDTNNGRLHSRYVFSVNEPRAWEVFVQTEFDQFRDLKFRNLAGGNARHRLVNSPSQTLFVGSGLFYEMQSFDHTPSRQTVRANIYLSYTYGWNAQTLSYAIAYIQPSLVAIADTRLLLQTGVGVMMTERLALDLQYNLTYDSRPPLDVVPLDMILLAGFSVKYK